MLAVVTLRDTPVERTAMSADGRLFTVRVGVSEDGYLPDADLDTVALTLHEGGEVVAALNTLLEPQHEREAAVLAAEIVTGLETGTLKPTAGALEPLADTIPVVRGRD